MIDSGKVSRRQRRAERRRVEEGRRAEGRPRRRVRAAQHDDAPRGRARRLRARDRRLPAGPRQVLLRRRVRALMFASDHGLTEELRVRSATATRRSTPAALRTRMTTPPRTRRTRATRPSIRDARLNQTITRCDLHHNNLATPGRWATPSTSSTTTSTATRAAIVTDSFYAGGHPGLPAERVGLREQPHLLSNNFNVLRDPRTPDVQVQSSRCRSASAS